MGVQPIGALIAGGVAKHLGASYTLLAFGSLVLIGSMVFITRVVMKASPRGAVTAGARATSD